MTHFSLRTFKLTYNPQRWLECQQIAIGKTDKNYIIGMSFAIGKPFHWQTVLTWRKRPKEEYWVYE